MNFLWALLGLYIVWRLIKAYRLFALKRQRSDGEKQKQVPTLQKDEDGVYRLKKKPRKK